jgi:hypothetical protein
MTGSLDLMANNNISVDGSLTYPTADVVTAANGTDVATRRMLSVWWPRIS